MTRNGDEKRASKRSAAKVVRRKSSAANAAKVFEFVCALNYFNLIEAHHEAYEGSKGSDEGHFAPSELPRRDPRF